MVYRALAAHWAEFCERAEEAGGVHRFVQREVDEYPRGLLEYGCVRVGCEWCDFVRLVALSCKPPMPTRSSRFATSALYLIHTNFRYRPSGNAAGVG